MYKKDLALTYNGGYAIKLNQTKLNHIYIYIYIYILDLYI